MAASSSSAKQNNQDGGCENTRQHPLPVLSKIMIMAAVRKHGSIFFRCLALKHVSMSNRICCSRKKSVRRLMSHFYHNNNKNGGRSHIYLYFNKLAAWSLSQNVTVKMTINVPLFKKMRDIQYAPKVLSGVYVTV